MNTDQAFDLLQNAGLSESSSIQTVRRWLREGKIKYEGGKGIKKTGYIIDNTDQAFDLLKDAGLSESSSILVVKRWLHEGKIKYEGNGNRKIKYISNDTTSKLLINDRMDQNTDEMIHPLQLKIQAQDKHIEEIEEHYENAKKILIQQRDHLKKEVTILKNDIKDLLKQNIKLRNELRKAKENKTNNTKSNFTTQSHDYRKKLGLSKIASNKDLLAEYKELLKITHPDHNGNAKLFHYIKTDYDNFRNSIKGK